MNENSKSLMGSIDATARSAADGASDLAASASAKLAEAAASFRDSAAERMNDARGALGESGDRLAETLRQAAIAPDASYVRSHVLSAIADGVASTADTLRDRTFGEMAEDMRAMARRNPGLVAAGAAVAGFALARLLRSSARPHRDEYRSARASADHAPDRSRPPGQGEGRS